MRAGKSSVLQALGVSLVFLVLFRGAGASDLEVTDYGDQVPSTEDFINALDPALSVKTRSLSPSEPVKKRSVSLGIEFRHDSSELTGEAQEVLNRLGGALVSPQLGEHKFLIEGHTDADGSEDYNQTLSEQRAMTVKNYLVNVFGVEGSRLQDMGKGEAELLDASNPGSQANRRVQIINLAE
jgi:outer membrane protein OmpA-like peptidoglycan-associated protein